MVNEDRLSNSSNNSAGRCPIPMWELLNKLKKDPSASLSPHYMTRRWCRDKFGRSIYRHFKREFSLKAHAKEISADAGLDNWRPVKVTTSYFANFYIWTLQKEVEGRLVEITAFPWEIRMNRGYKAPINVAFTITKNSDSSFMELKQFEDPFEPDCIWFERLKMSLVDFIPDEDGNVEFEYGRDHALSAISEAKELLLAIKNITKTNLIIEHRLTFKTEAYMFCRRRRNTEDIIPLHDNDPWEEKKEAQQSAKELCRRQKELDVVCRLQKIEEIKAKQIQEEREEREKHLVEETVRSQRSHTSRIEGEYRKPTREIYRNTLRFVNATRRAGQDDETITKEAQNLAEVRQWFEDKKQIEADKKIAEDLRKADIDNKFDKDTEDAIEKSKGPTSSTLFFVRNGKWEEEEGPENDFPGNYYIDKDSNGNDGIMFHGKFIPSTKPNDEGASTSSGDFGTWLENARAERQQEDAIKELEKHKDQLANVLEELAIIKPVSEVKRIDKGKGRAAPPSSPLPTKEESEDEEEFELIDVTDYEPNGESSGDLNRFREEDQLNIALAKSAKETKEAKEA